MPDLVFAGNDVGDFYPPYCHSVQFVSPNSTHRETMLRFLLARAVIRRRFRVANK